MPVNSYMRKRYGSSRRRYSKMWGPARPYGVRFGRPSAAIRATRLPELKQYTVNLASTAVGNLATSPIYLDLNEMTEGVGISNMVGHRFFCEGFRIRFTIATGTSNAQEDLLVRTCVVRNKVSPSSQAYRTGSNIFQGNTAAFSTGATGTDALDHLNPWDRDVYDVKYDQVYKVGTTAAGQRTTPGSITKSIWIPVKRSMHCNGSGAVPVNNLYFLWFIARVSSGDLAESMSGTVMATSTMFFRET